MGTIADKLTYLNETKIQFKEKLNKLGADILNNTTFRNYLIYLNNLYNGLFNLTDMSKNGIVGRTNQDDTPSPSTPQEIKDLNGDITYSVNGKNFLPINIESGTTKNGLTITKNEKGYYVLNGTATANTTWDLYTGENITIPSGTYTGSLIDRTNIIDGYIRLDNGAYQTIFTSSSDTNTFTIAEPFTFNRFYIYISNQKTFNNQVIKPMLEIGTEATSFEPYIPKRDFTLSLNADGYDIHLDKISTYEDKIYSNDNKFYLHKEIGRVVLNGSENWGYSNSIFSTGSSLHKYIGSTITAISNYFKGGYNKQSATNYYNSNDDNTIGFNQNNILVRDDSITSESNFKTWLSTHNVSVYFPLETPTDTEITSASYPTLYNQLKEIQDYLIKYKSKYELILNYDKPNIKY